MSPTLFKGFNKILSQKTINNIVDSSYFIRQVRKLAGASVLTIESNSAGVITTIFSLLGFTSFVFWYSIYFYCFYKIHADDQTILRNLYDTKLKSYGEEAERITNAMFVMYAMWKVPFDLSGSTEEMQLIIDIDCAFKNLGEEPNYAKNLYTVFIICFAQIIISSTRVFSVWMSLINLGKDMPMAKLYHVIFTDAIAFIITTQCCTYLLIMRRRYRILNNVLESIKPNTVSELFILPYNKSKTIPIPVQEKNISKKIKACGRIYSMLHKASATANRKYGLVILLIMTMSLAQIILYLYYFMEATASGLFHDVRNYVDFLIYDFWQIGYAVTIIIVFIYFSEETVKEAQVTANIAHEIINSDLDPSSTILTEAANLSLQTLHQIPSFTAHGLFKLDYVMLLEGARSVTTFLVILLQFVTDKRAN